MTDEVTKQQLQYMRYGSINGMAMCSCAGSHALCHDILDHCDWCRLFEQKVDQIAAELTRRQQEREDTALEYKRYTSIAV